MTSGRTLAALLLLLVAGTQAGRAQTAASAPLTLTLEEAVVRATASSHRIDETRARGDAAAAVPGQRRATTLPQVAGIAGYTRTNHVDEFGIPWSPNQFLIIYPDIPDNYRARLDVQWPIYTGGRLQALEAASRFEATAATHDVNTTVVDVRLDVARAFWGLVVARETQRVVDESLAQMTEHVRYVRNQLDAGLAPPNDVMTAQAQEARERMFSIQARTATELAQADLGRLIDVAPGTHIVPSALLELPAIDASVESLIAEALQHRPERKALEERVNAATERQRAADAGRRPTVAAAGGVDYARPNPHIFPRMGEWRRTWDASVNVSWPLFDGGKTGAEVAEAAAALRAVQARLAEFDSVVGLEIRQRMSELESSRASLDAADAGIQSAAEARRVLGERFAAGVATSIDVVDAQVALLEAQLDRTRAIASARLAEARLNRALGR